MSGSRRFGRSTYGSEYVERVHVPEPEHVGLSNVKTNRKSRARAHGGPPPPKLATRSIPTGSSSASRKEAGSASVKDSSYRQRYPGHQEREDQLQREKRRSEAKPQESQGRSDEVGKKQKKKKKEKEKKRSGLLSFMRSII